MTISQFNHKLKKYERYTLFIQYHFITKNNLINIRFYLLNL